MMTCPPRIRARRGGFTLIEIVIVLLVIGVVTGGAISAMVASSPERKLRNASGEIELLAKKARAKSILNQTPYAIEFHAGFARLLPFSEASETGLTTALGNPIGGEAVDGERQHQEVGIDSDITLSVRRWNRSEFITPTETRVPVWRFDPDGLSEPITVRLTTGESYAQDTYHPLTATIADSELEAN